MEYLDVKTLLPGKIRKLLNTNRKILDENEQFKKNFYEAICKDLDKKIPKEIGEMLISENHNPNYTILIHRTSRASKEAIFSNGLIIAGGNDLEYTTSRYDTDISFLISIVNAYGYKNRLNHEARCIVIKVPNTSLEYVKGKTKPILYQTDNIAEQGGGMVVVEGKYQTVLLPEYVFGSIEYDDNNLISNFEFNPHYSEIHNYKNDGLVCTQEAINSYKKQIIKNTQINNNNLTEFIKQQEQENKNINDIICTQNTNYMNYMNENTTIRTEAELKEFSKKGLLFSTFNRLTRKIKEHFTKEKGDNTYYVDR